MPTDDRIRLGDRQRSASLGETVDRAQQISTDQKYQRTAFSGRRAAKRWSAAEAPRSRPPVLLALASGRRVSRKSACKDRSSLGSISRFVSARQLDLVYDRDRQDRAATPDQAGLRSRS